jgi:tRNA splicing ligase
LEKLHISFNLEELEHYFHIDNGNNEEFIAALLEDVETNLEATMQCQIEICEDEMDEDESHETNVSSENSILFEGFDRLYSRVVDI